MNSDEMKEMFLRVLEAAKKKFSFKLKHFCIMSNHIHLLIEPGQGTSLSKLMQWILSVFAIRFNRMMGVKGHVWYDRFKSKIIAGFKQLVHTFQYISDNPRKAGLCKKASNYAFGGLFELKYKHLRLLDPPDEWIFLIQDIG